MDSSKRRGTALSELSLLISIFAHHAQEAISENDAKRAAWATQRVMSAHSALVFERDLKPIIWRGYGNVGADQIGEALELWSKTRTTAVRSSGRRS